MHKNSSGCPGSQKMFRRCRNQRQGPVPDDRIRNGPDAEAAGNAGMVLDHYMNNDFNRFDALPLSGSNEENIKQLAKEIPDADPIMDLGNYYANDLNLLDKKSKKTKASSQNGAHEAGPDALLNSSLRSNNAGRILNDIVNIADRDGGKDDGENGLLNSGIIENGMRENNRIDEAPAPDKSKARPGKGGKAPNAAKNSDLDAAGRDMKPVDGWDFTAQKLDKPMKPGFWKNFLSAAAYYSGKFVGKIFGGAVKLFGLLTGKKIMGMDLREAHENKHADKSDYQEEINRKRIPGWDGEEFEQERPEGDDLNIDFRRTPEVWSRLIAEEAGEGDKGRDPVITAYIEQTSKNRLVNERGVGGHSSIGIEYSRKNPASGEWERYRVRYGFLPMGAGSTGSLPGLSSITTTRTFPRRCGMRGIHIIPSAAGSKPPISRSMPF